jgi:hypothetical protein
MPPGNLLDHLTWIHTEFPAIDRSGFLAGVSVCSTLFAMFVVYRAFKQKKCVTKILCFLLAIVILFYSTFHSKKILVTCSNCGVNYSYCEARFCGFRVNVYDFETREHNCSYLVSYPMNSRRCFHFWITTAKVRYFGGMIPAMEYSLGDIIHRTLKSDEKLVEKPYQITREMILTEAHDENGQSYTKIAESDK